MHFYYIFAVVVSHLVVLNVICFYFSGDRIYICPHVFRCIFPYFVAESFLFINPLVLSERTYDIILFRFLVGVTHPNLKIKSDINMNNYENQLPSLHPFPHYLYHQ